MYLTRQARRFNLQCDARTRPPADFPHGKYRLFLEDPLSARSGLSETCEVAASTISAIVSGNFESSPSSYGRPRALSQIHPVPAVFAEPLSPWTASAAKRLFDCASVLIALPLVLPVFLVVALAIRFTSPGPVLFLQKRIGRYGQCFTIFKFRTMSHSPHGGRSEVTTVENQAFTPVGPFLRRFKLDELPQLLNVLLGDMSLVGPRPKLPAHQTVPLDCRPGITGAATIAFAQEEQFLAHLPIHDLDAYYHSVVLPAKIRLDAEYMSRATLFSDLKLIIDSASRRWDSSVMSHLLDIEQDLIKGTARKSHPPRIDSARLAVLSRDESFAQAD